MGFVVAEASSTLHLLFMPQGIPDLAALKQRFLAFQQFGNEQGKRADKAHQERERALKEQEEAAVAAKAKAEAEADAAAAAAKAKADAEAAAAVKSKADAAAAAAVKEAAERESAEKARVAAEKEAAERKAVEKAREAAQKEAELAEEAGKNTLLGGTPPDDTPGLGALLAGGEVFSKEGFLKQLGEIDKDSADGQDAGERLAGMADSSASVPASAMPIAAPAPMEIGGRSPAKPIPSPAREEPKQGGLAACWAGVAKMCGGTR